MKSFLYWAFTICILLQWINNVNSQLLPPDSTTAQPPTTSDRPPTTSAQPPTTSQPPTTTRPPTTTTFTPIIPPTSTTVPPSSTTTPLPSSTTVPPTTITTTTTTTSRGSSSTSSNGSSPTQSGNSGPNSDDDNTKVIVGAVVGGVVGLALIGGFLAWLNRRGGCTSKSNHRKERKADFEDFGLAERDFPHHRSPPTAKATAVASGAAVGSMASPTIPRLNDQGNYYNDTSNHQQHYMQQGYDQYHDGGAYYYPQEGGYYDENGYYYDGTTVHGGGTSYDPMSPPQQNYHPGNMMSNNAPLPPLPNANHSNEVYKPDSIR